MINKIHTGDCISVMQNMEPCSVQCVVTSPPYYGLRDYGVNGQLGLEKTPEEYVEKVVQIFREVRRVLRDDGTLWLNLGDTYMSSGGASRHHGYTDPKYKDGRKVEHFEPQAYPHPVIKPKDLIGIPWRVAFALQADGWYLRQDIIWAKPNPMPESVTDRCTKSHEYIFLLTKSARYYYDAEAVKEKSAAPGSVHIAKNGQKMDSMSGIVPKNNITSGETRNRRSVWTVNTQPFKGAHFAVFPEKLIVPCIKAGSKEGDVVFDPFMGSGTVAVVAHKLNRNWIGCELNPEYVKLATERIERVRAQGKLAFEIGDT
jgi:DNA modification methylase